MAKLLNGGLPANGAPPVPTAWSILRDKITWSMLHRHIMWSADRVIFFYQPLSGPLSAHEWTPGGYKRANLGAWPQEPAGSAKFTIRLVPPGFDFHVGPQSI
jgi:hypothetical protein